MVGNFTEDNSAMNVWKEDGKKMIFFLSFSMAFMLLIYAPLELYFTNISEWWYDIYFLLPVLIVLFLVAIVTSVIILFIIRKIFPRLCDYIIGLYFVIFICLYIQGNYLAGGLPIFDGRTIEWSEYPVDRWLSIIMWLGVASIAIIVSRREKIKKYLSKIVINGCLFITGILAVTILVLGISSNGFSKKLNIGATAHDLFEMSSDTNFVILVLDCIDAGDFSKIIRENPQYKDCFTDFTYYENTMGAYGYTKHSVPFIISGDWYENDEEFEDYVVNACTESPLITELRQQNWDMGLYDNDLLVQDERFLQYDNVMYNQYGTVSYGTFVLWEVKMVCYKYAPFDLKRFFVMDPVHFASLIKPAESEEVFFFADSNKRFYRDIQNKDISKVENRKFKFIHLDGAHADWDLNEKVEVSSSATYESEIEASIVITDAYLNKLKEANVYNNSVIIIMSDHGYKWEDALHHQNPILLVKGIDEVHNFRISNSPISYTDLQGAYQNLLQGKIGDEIFDVDEGKSRERRYLFYDNDITDEIMYEYVQYGEANDWNTFKPTGKEYHLK